MLYDMVLYLLHSLRLSFIRIDVRTVRLLCIVSIIIPSSLKWWGLYLAVPSRPEDSVHDPNLFLVQTFIVEV